jgi:hypothetical protein
MSEGRYTTIDDTGKQHRATLSDGTVIVFTRALSANHELSLARHRSGDVDDYRDLLTGCLVHMAPQHNGDLASLFDRLGTDEIVRLVSDAAKELRAIPFTEAPASSPPVVTAGSTGAGAQASPQISTS